MAIIAILPAIAIPAYQDIRSGHKSPRGMNLASGAKAAVWDYVSTAGRLPTSNQSAGLAKSTSIVGDYVSSVDPASAGKITVASSLATSRHRCRTN